MHASVAQCLYIYEIMPIPEVPQSKHDDQLVDGMMKPVMTEC